MTVLIFKYQDFTSSEKSMISFAVFKQTLKIQYPCCLSGHTVSYSTWTLYNLHVLYLKRTLRIFWLVLPRIAKLNCLDKNTLGWSALLNDCSLQLKGIFFWLWIPLVIIVILFKTREAEYCKKISSSILVQMTEVKISPRWYMKDKKSHIWAIMTVNCPILNTTVEKYQQTYIHFW